VVAPQGTAFTENQARVLKRFVSEVVLVLPMPMPPAGKLPKDRSKLFFKMTWLCG